MNYILFIFIIFSLLSCNFVGKTEVSPNFLQSGQSGMSITSVSVVNDQLVINGSDLSDVTGVRITGPSSFDESFSIESKSSASITANGLANIAFALNGLFNLILTDAEGAATFQVTFTLQDGAVTASKLSDMGAGVGQILKYNGTTWVASDLNALTYAGNWDGTANSPDLSGGGSAGEYYIVNNAGAFDLSGGPGTNSWAVGDWAVWNDVDSRWEKVDNAASVTSFNGRSGAVTPQAGDYTWAQINKTSSVLSEVADIDAPAGDGSDTGKVLKWNNATSRWELGDDLSGGGAGSVTSTEISDGAIVDADVNGAAAIAQSKVANLTTDLAAKVPLAGGTMTGDLTVPNLITSGNVDGVDVSALNTTVGTNTTNIGNNTTAIGALDTDDVSEGTNLYFTDARVINAPITGFASGAGTVNAADTVLEAIEKLDGNIAASGTGDLLDGGNTNAATVTIGTNDANSLAFETNNSTAMTILSGGNVGIGTTSPSSLLEAKGNLSSSLTGTVTVTSGTAAVTGTGTAFDTELNVGDAIKIGSEIFTVSAIGSATSLTLDSNHVAGETAVTATTDSDILNLINGDNQDLLTVLSNGHVGIGTTSPQTNFHVDGGACVTSDGTCSSLPAAGEISAETTLNTGADYAEYFASEDPDLRKGDLVGLNLESGFVRAYQSGDSLIGVVSTNPGVIGNSKLRDRENTILVALVGQVPFNNNQVEIINGFAYTLDKSPLGMILKSGHIYINLSSVDGGQNRQISSLQNENKLIKVMYQEIESENIQLANKLKNVESQLEQIKKMLCKSDSSLCD